MSTYARYTLPQVKLADLVGEVVAIKGISREAVPSQSPVTGQKEITEAVKAHIRHFAGENGERPELVTTLVFPAAIRDELMQRRGEWLMGRLEEREAAGGYSYVAIADLEDDEFALAATRFGAAFKG